MTIKAGELRNMNVENVDYNMMINQKQKERFTLKIEV